MNFNVLSEAQYWMCGLFYHCLLITHTHTHIYSFAGIILDKEMATWTVLAWRILCTDKSGGLQFIGLQGIRHNSVTNTHMCNLFHGVNKL